MVTENLLLYLAGIIMLIYVISAFIDYYVSKQRDKVVDINSHMHLFFLSVIFLIIALYLFIRFIPHNLVFMYSFIFSLIIGSAFYLYHHYKKESSKSYIDKFYAPHIPFVRRKKKREIPHSS